MTRRAKITAGVAGLAAAALAVPFACQGSGVADGPPPGPSLRGLTQGNGHIDVFVGSTPTATGATCTGADVTTATFATRVSAAAAGDVLCLTTGSYGDWTGTNKSSPGITIQEKSGATATFGDLNLTGTIGWFTIDGIDYSGGKICAPTHDVTIKNAEQAGAFTIYGGTSNPGCSPGVAMVNANILLHNIRFTLANCPDASCLGFEGRLELYNGPTSGSAGLTIEDSTFDGRAPGSPCGDGIQLTGSAGPGVTIRRNEIVGFDQTRCASFFPNPADAPHSDGIQMLGIKDVVIDSNYIHGVSTGIVAYDGTDGNITITNNVMDDLDQDPIRMAGDAGGSVVAHNTVTSSAGAIQFDQNNSSGVTTAVTVRNNIARNGIQFNDGATATVNDYNLCSSGCVGAHSLNGTPAWVGGSSPTTYAGFALSGGSLGENVGSDGTDIGVVP